MGTEIGLKSIHELQGCHFFIPSYQRGYRWEAQQVQDLLNDLEDFFEKSTAMQFYCLQPLVVKEITSKNVYEVIDGQQRLTTIFLIWQILNYFVEVTPGVLADTCQKKRDIAPIYTLSYETRQQSQEFLNDFEAQSDDNIDYWYITKARKVILTWFDKFCQSREILDEAMHQSKKLILQNFRHQLLYRVKFIWYQVDEQTHPIDIFKRLNIGKISLTNAELIKALLLSRAHFSQENSDTVHAKQIEIATVWNQIEQTLQDEAFWLFLQPLNTPYLTRIDMIFHLLYLQNLLDVQLPPAEGDIYHTFRYLDVVFREKGYSFASLMEVWDKVLNIFHTFKEWYNDLVFYHYVGYLVAIDAQIMTTLLNQWREMPNKQQFRAFLIRTITQKIANSRDLTRVYAIDQKTQCRPLLLLHNIQTVIQQNQLIQETYQQAVFYKFPFNLYKKEKWDVEHIDPVTDNDLLDETSQREYLLWVYHSLKHLSSSVEDIRQHDKNSLLVDIEKMLNQEIDKDTFQCFRQELENRGLAFSHVGRLSDEEKNTIGNFVLLDASTNRSYGNALFGVKRRAIISKDRGTFFESLHIINGDIQGKEVSQAQQTYTSSFVPPCTKYVFLKYYSPFSASQLYWERPDANAYQQDMLRVLSPFNVSLGQGDQDV